MEIVKIIVTAVISIAAVILGTSACITTVNVNKNSEGATIESAQSAQQKNDSIKFDLNIEKK